MRNLLRNYFHFTKLERQGILVLAILCLMLFLIPFLFSDTNPDKVDFNSFKEEILDFENAFEEKEFSKNEVPQEVVLTLFNPNDVSFEELVSFGLSEKVAHIWINFLEKGGGFYKKEDVKKIYGLTEANYLKLENYITIPDHKNPVSKNPEPVEAFVEPTSERFEFDPNLVSKEALLSLGFPERTANNLLKFRAKGGKIREANELLKIYGMEQPLFETLLPFITIEKNTKTAFENTNSTKVNPVEQLEIDINGADAATWQKLKGIGPYYANKIVNFRTKLGGFYSKDQVAETYGLPDSVFQKIKPQLIKSIPHQKINLNITTVEELAQHPYIKRHEASIIINYRKQHGDFKDVADLSNIKVLSASQIEKITPYISIN